MTTINTLELATILQTALDQQITVESTTGWMDNNAGQVIYNGGRDIKVPTISTTGLMDYDRDKGYPLGGVTLGYKNYTMTQDRAAKFYLDAMDVNESNFIANATNVAATFQRQHVIPEVDAYRYSKIATLAIAAGQATGGYTPSEGTILKRLLQDIGSIQDEIGDVPLVIMMAADIATILSTSTELSRSLNVSEFTSGLVNTKVKSIDTHPILTAPSARMKTKYLFKDEAAGGGFEPTADAKKINWIITPKSVPIGLCKTDIMRIFDPMTTQTANAWQIDYRKYHDLIMLSNKMNSVFVNIQEALN